jgi:DNA-binding HxlR family transcriptional regulator
VLGERWTLLIVRELLLGPRRYGEICAQLPDLATDVLTARLKMLAERGLVSRVETGGVGRGVTYSLTPAGYEIRQVIEQLGELGFRWMTTPPQTTHQITLRWALTSVRPFLDPTTCPPGDCDLITPEQTYRLTNRGSTIELSYAEPSASTAAPAGLRGPDFGLVAVLTGHLRLADTTVELQGDTTVAVRWMNALHAAFPRQISAAR